jgi:hypothetical protein
MPAMRKKERSGPGKVTVADDAAPATTGLDAAAEFGAWGAGEAFAKSSQEKQSRNIARLETSS